MEHLQINEQSRFKLMEKSNVQLVDFLVSEKFEQRLIGKDSILAANFISRIKPTTLAEFLSLAQKVVTNRATLKNDIPDKLVLLSITEEEKEKIERENAVASTISIDDDESGGGEMFVPFDKHDRDNYKQILVNRGCYKIVPSFHEQASTCDIQSKNTDECHS